jgi:beta-lactamase class A
MKITRRQCLWALGSSAAGAVGKDLVQEWQQIATETDGTVGAAVLHLASGQMVNLHGSERFPLASVCKVPIAMNMLALVDEGKMALDQQIEVLPRDVFSGVSEIARRWPAQRLFPLGEMIELMVARSDNTAVEALFRIGGEGPAMATRMRQWTVAGVRVDRSERQCGLDRNGVDHYPPPAEWRDAAINALIAGTPPATRYRSTQRFLTDPRDTGTPEGTVQLLAKLFRGELLSKSSTTRLVEILKATTTFPTRLKGLLPPGTVVAHKTGSTETVNGFAAATNDSGVIYLPGNRGELAISIYLKASTRDDASRDRVIARISRAAFDFYQ